MSTFRRNLAKDSHLPYDAEIEYIEAVIAGGLTPYIDLEFVPQGYDNDFHISFMVGSIGSPSFGYRFFGSYTSDEANGYRIIRPIASDTRCRIENGCIANGPNGYITIPIGERIDLSLYHDYRYTFNDKEGVISNQVHGKENTQPFMMFVNNPLCVGSMSLYGFKWLKDGRLMLDLIPVRKGREGFLYDRVSGKLFGNSGTGQFILGPDKKKAL